MIRADQGIGVREAGAIEGSLCGIGAGVQPALDIFSFRREERCQFAQADHFDVFALRVSFDA